MDLLNRIRTSKEIVLAAIDNALSGDDDNQPQTPVDANDPWANNRQIVNQLRSAGDSAKAAAEQEANRIAGIIGSLTSFREQITKSRRHHREIAEAIEPANLDAVLRDLSSQFALRWDAGGAVRGRLVAMMAEYTGIKASRKMISESNDAELASQEKAFREFITGNRADLDRLGLLQPTDVE